MAEVRTCLYCLESGGPWSKEHVLSKFLGGPNRYQLDDVCENCNSKILSSYEDYFKEETAEGYLASMYKLGRGSGYRSLGRKLTVTKKAANLDIPPEWFFTIDKLTLTGRLESQSTLTSGTKTYTTFKKLKGNALKKKVKWLRSDSAEVVNLGKPGAEPFANLTEVGGQPSNTSEGKELTAGTRIGPVEFRFRGERNLTTNRVIAKNAFNYLCQCALSTKQERFTKRLLDTGFNPLRCYILLPESSYSGGELVTCSEEQIMFNGTSLKAGSPVHYIRLGKKNHYFDGTSGVPKGYQKVLYVHLNLFSVFTYEVFLAFDQFPELDEEIFGCAHLIDLATDKWIGLDHNNNACGEDSFALIQGGHRFQATQIRAYHIWQERDCLHGSDQQDWLQAESLLGLNQ